MAETQAWDSASYRCGRCGYTFTATSQTEYAKLYGEHTGIRCLAVLSRMTPDQLDYLANDLERIVRTIPGCTVKELLQTLRTVAQSGRKTSEPVPEGPGTGSGALP